MTQLSDIIAELTREQGMRRHVWNTVPGSNKTQFVNLDHQKYYNRLTDAKAIFEAMTPTEFNVIVSRIERHKAELESQTTLNI